MKFLNSKKNRYLVWSLSVLILLVLTNIYLNFYPFVRLDFSQGKIYSLSDTSKEVIKNLDDVVNIKVYMTQDLPLEAKPTAKNLKAILSEVQRNNKDRIRVTYLDPTKDEKIKSEADFIGIQQLQFSSLKSNKLEVSNAYFGLAMYYGQNNVVLPIAGDVENLEYFLMSGLKRVTAKVVPKVIIAEEKFSQIEETDITYFRKLLGQNYIIADANLDSDAPLAIDADVLVIINRNGKLNDKNKTKIDEWIKSGKGLIVFQEKINVDQYMKAAVKTETGLEEILKNYGFEIEPKLITDESAFVANFKSSKGTYTIPYQYWLMIRPENISRKVPAMSGLSKLIFEWASPMKLSGNAKAFISTTDKAILDDSFKNLFPADQAKAIGEKQQLTVGGINNENNTKIAVIGDADFIKDAYVINNQQNLAMALNLVDYFSQDNSLMQIRSKSISSYPIKIVNDAWKNATKIINLVAPVILLAGIYFVNNIIRKKKNSEY